MLLIAAGGADLVRQFIPRRWIGYLIVAVAVLSLGVVSDAVWAAVIAVLAGGAWVWTMPDETVGRLSFWPAIVLAVACVGSVALWGARPPSGVLAAVWHLDSPIGAISVDQALLGIGVLMFLLESGNVVVRAALAGERMSRPAPAGTPTADGPALTTVPIAAFKGGRLIGPLERVIVLMLTLAAAYPLLAAVLAAKGIVRFPEISRDGDTGISAEYFLVGSLVSWIMALAGALLLWWSRS